MVGTGEGLAGLLGVVVLVGLGGRFCGIGRVWYIHRGVGGSLMWGGGGLIIWDWDSWRAKNSPVVAVEEL